MTMYMIGGSIIIIFMSVQLFVKVHDQFYYGKLTAGSSYIARICKSIITILISIGKKPQKAPRRYANNKSFMKQSVTN